MQTDDRLPYQDLSSLNEEGTEHYFLLPEVFRKPISDTDSESAGKFIIRNPTPEPDRALSDHHQLECLVYTPEKSNHIGIVMFAGGSYLRLAIDIEGTRCAKLLAAKGYTVFVCNYRMPNGKKYTKQSPFGSYTSLYDAKRSMRWVRANQDKWQLKHVGVMGFSAGGHLAGMLGAYYDFDIASAFDLEADLGKDALETSLADIYEQDIKTQDIEAQDEIDALSAKADFNALIYPVVTTTQPAVHNGSHFRLVRHKFEQFSDDPKIAQAQKQKAAFFSLEKNANPEASPYFLIHACDDQVVDVENSLYLWQALKQNNVPVEMYLFEEGGHGFGVGREGLSNAHWADMFDTWVRGKLA